MKQKFNKVAVLGLGYIGLPTAGIIASHGIPVAGVDTNPRVVDTINNGTIKMAEPDFDSVVNMAVINKTLKASLKPETADVFIIAVPTPLGPNREPDLSHVHAAADSIVPILRKGNLIILESTSPVGTTEAVSVQLAKARPDLSFPHQGGGHVDVHIAYCPERVLPGRILRELVENDRIIGGLTSACGEKAKALYRVFVKGHCHVTDARTAEMAKLAENAYRDLNIAFSNELSIICDQLGIDVWNLISLANQHPRVNILNPSAGVGGHCIPIDPWFIAHSAPEAARLLRLAREVNDSKPLFVAGKIKSMVAENVRPKIACLGLTYKGNTDDIRESPAIRIVSLLARDLPKAEIMVADPFLLRVPDSLNGFCNVAFMPAGEAVPRAEVVAILVDHGKFRELRQVDLAGKKVYDACGVMGRMGN